MSAMILWVVASLAAGAAGAAASRDAAAFYATLDRPSWAPPAAAFGPVWTILYVLMGVAAGLVSRVRAPGRRASRARALTVFATQLVLNALWTWLFFGWRLGGVAFAEILLLIALVGWTAFEFSRLSRTAGWLLAPYLAWLGFAAALNFAIWRANPGHL